MHLRVLNEVPEHMAQELRKILHDVRRSGLSSMKFLSTWLRNFRPATIRRIRDVLNEVPEHMAQESRSCGVAASMVAPQ